MNTNKLYLQHRSASSVHDLLSSVLGLVTFPQSFLLCTAWGMTENEPVLMVSFFITINGRKNASSTNVVLNVARYIAEIQSFYIQCVT